MFWLKCKTCKVSFVKVLGTDESMDDLECGRCKMYLTGDGRLAEKIKKGEDDISQRS